MWIENENPIAYKIVIDNNVIQNVTRGVYSATRIYEGTGEHTGYLVLKFNNIYVITDKIGDDINVTTNYPFVNAGVYTIDTTKKPTPNATVYKSSNNKYLTIDTNNKVKLYGSYLIENDDFHDDGRYNRDGVPLTGRRVYENIAYDWDEEIPIIPTNLVNYLLTSDDIDNGLNEDDISNIAKDKFLARGYVYKSATMNNWKGWYSTSLTGAYLPFGGSTGNMEFGYYQYSDVANNRYIKGFDITEKDGVWSVVYRPNGELYTANAEPKATDTVFSNHDATPPTITLTFDNYITKDRKIFTTMIADDLAK